MITDEFHVHGEPSHGWSISEQPATIGVKYAWMAYYGNNRIAGFITGEDASTYTADLGNLTAARAIKRAKDEHQFFLDCADNLA
jgi:hypothetical protein